MVKSIYCPDTKLGSKLTVVSSLRLNKGAVYFLPNEILNHFDLSFVIQDFSVSSVLYGD